MDDPELDQERHERALRGLARLNVLSGSAGPVWNALRRFSRRNPGRRLRLLDVATGGGDLPIQLWRRAQKHRLPLEITGLDISERAIQFARRQAARHQAEITFQQGNALDGLADTYDVVTCCLFLHHLEDRQAIQLLRVMAQAASGMVVVNDLQRGRWNHLLVTLGGWLVTRSDVVHHDGPRSVRAAFSRRELLAAAEEAGMSGATVRGSGPCRMQLLWRRP